LRHVTDAQPATDVDAVGLGRAGADAEFLADLFAGVAMGHQAQHLALPWSEAGGDAAWALQIGRNGVFGFA